MTTPSADPPIPALQHFFVVRLGSGMLLGTFTEVDGIGAQFETFDYEEGGNPYYVKLRGRTQQTNITLKAGLTSSVALMQWVLDPNPAPKDLYIAFKDATANNNVREFGFYDAIPVRWTGPSANVGASAVATESLELAHQGFANVSAKAAS
jgi:phage tail-like protein